MGTHGHLSRWPESAVQYPARATRDGQALAGQLSGMEAQDGRDLRTQSRVLTTGEVGSFFAPIRFRLSGGNKMLLCTLLELLAGWRPGFAQSRSHRRAMSQALGILTSFGRLTLSRALCALGRQQQDWSAEYRLHARADWQRFVSARAGEGSSVLLRTLCSGSDRRHAPAQDRSPHSKRLLSTRPALPQVSL